MSISKTMKIFFTTALIFCLAHKALAAGEGFYCEETQVVTSGSLEDPSFEPLNLFSRMEVLPTQGTLWDVKIYNDQGQIIGDDSIAGVQYFPTAESGDAELISIAEAVIGIDSATQDIAYQWYPIDSSNDGTGFDLYEFYVLGQNGYEQAGVVFTFGFGFGHCAQYGLLEK